MIASKILQVWALDKQQRPPVGSGSVMAGHRFPCRLRPEPTVRAVTRPAHNPIPSGRTVEDIFFGTLKITKPFNAYSGKEYFGFWCEN